MEIDSAYNSKWFADEAGRERIGDELQQVTAEELKVLGWDNTEENRNRLFRKQKAEIIKNAKIGDPKAQCLLAGIYICGIDEKEDMVHGHAWFRIA